MLIFCLGRGRIYPQRLTKGQENHRPPNKNKAPINRKIAEADEMKQIFIIFTVLIFLSGCTIKRTITLPDKSVYVVDSLKEDVVTFEKNKDGIKIIVDGKPAPSLFEKVMMMLFYSMPDVEIAK